MTDHQPLVEQGFVAPSLLFSSFIEPSKLGICKLLSYCLLATANWVVGATVYLVNSELE